MQTAWKVSFNLKGLSGELRPTSIPVYIYQIIFRQLNRLLQELALLDLERSIGTSGPDIMKLRLCLSA